MSVGKRRSALLLQALDSKEQGSDVEKLFNESKESLSLAGEWPAPGRERQRRSPAIWNW